MRATAKGFTLIELMVAVAVLAITLGFAVPGYQSVVNGNRLAGTANEFVATLQSARVEAIRRGRRIAVCASADANAASPTCASANIDGWITFVDKDADGSFGAADELLQRSTIDGPVAVSDLPTVVYRSDGLARDAAGDPMPASAARLSVEGSHPTQNVRCIAIDAGGVQVQTPDAHDAECG
jgi:type IV fimbrial biogenesis protein FimT